VQLLRVREKSNWAEREVGWERRKKVAGEGKCVIGGGNLGERQGREPCFFNDMPLHNHHF